MAGKKKGAHANKPASGTAKVTRSTNKAIRESTVKSLKRIALKRISEHKPVKHTKTREKHERKDYDD